MKSVVLGTAGHVDHGKTALVEALTGVNTDRWQEERERGITIDIGFAHYPHDSADLSISVVDVPGHEDFVKNMLAGATGVDLLLLVVAADEGPMPQTREHLWIAKLLGVKSGVAAITKTDLVDQDWLDLVKESVAEQLNEVFDSRDWPIVPVSTVTRVGLEDLDRSILAAADEIVPRRSDDLFRLPIDRAFTVRGVGTVVTGTVWSGKVSTGEEVRLLPHDRSVRLRSVQVHGAEVEVAQAGQRAALALVGLDRGDVSRGAVLTSDEVWRSHNIINARIVLLPDSPFSLRHWQRLRFHLGTAETMARLVLPAGDQLRPGDGAAVQLRLERPIVSRAGDRFVVRFYSPVITIGGGIVLDPWAVRLKRRERDSFAAAAGDVTEDAAARVLGLVGHREEAGAGERELAILSGFSPAEIKNTVKALEDEGQLRRVGDLWFARRAFAAARQGVLDALAAQHASDSHARGMGLELLRRSVGPSTLVNAALADLQAEGRVRIEGSVAALAEHQPTLQPRQEEIAAGVQRLLEEGGLAPPDLKALAAGLGVPEEDLLVVLRFLAERGLVVAVTPDLYYHSGVMLVVKERVERLLSGGQPVKPGGFRDVLGISRKYLIPLLEHLDAGGVTRRTPQGRVLRDPG